MRQNFVLEKPNLQTPCNQYNLLDKINKTQKKMTNDLDDKENGIVENVDIVMDPHEEPAQKFSLCIINVLINLSIVYYYLNGRW